MFTSLELYTLLKTVWVDPDFGSVLAGCDAPLFVATEKAYFLQNYKKMAKRPDSARKAIEALSAQDYYDMRVIILPPFSQIPMARKEIRHLLQLCLKDFSLHTDKSGGGGGAMYAQPIGPRGVDWFDIHSLALKKGKIKQYLQGGKSVMRQKIIIPKVQALRAQIVCDFRIEPTEVVLPRKFAPELKMDPYPLFDPKTGPQMRPIPPEICLIMKRDPAIHQASISLVDRVQFTDSDLQVVSPLTMVHKNADIDGDTYSTYPIYSSMARAEADELIHPRRNIYMKDVARLAFSQMHILYLHNNLHLLSGTYAKIGLELRDQALDRIRASESHRLLYTQYFRDTMSVDEFQLHCVPTGSILKQLARIVYLRHGNEECFNFFIEANRLVVHLGNRYVYYVGLSLVCPALLCITGSGAKSSLDAYKLLLDKLTDIDGSPEIRPILNTIPFNQGLYQRVIGDMALSARLVPKNGYNWYKMDLEWKQVQIGRFGNVYYCGEFLLNLLDSYSTNLLLKMVRACVSGDEESSFKLRYYQTTTSKRKIMPPTPTRAI